jgi:alpha-glucosidase/alpha-D-xyloside xylohydrolase
VRIAVGLTMSPYGSVFHVSTLRPSPAGLARTVSFLYGALALCHASLAREETPLRYAGHDVQLSISEITPHTVRITLAARDAGAERPRPDESPVLLRREWPAPRLEASSLAKSRDLDLGDLSAQITASPLSLAFATREGRTVQRIEVSATTGEVTFALGDGPVFGLGGGGAGFDRRSTFDFMDNGHRAGEYQIHGSRVPVPLLISPAGWALFLHRPWNAAIDLRKDGGRILPRQAARGPSEQALPFDLFLIHASQPAELIKEYVTLTGKPAMPPKWALGYMQSHRTLGGPDEVLKIAQTFRDKHLPCDALIYLGTGYTPAGWNTGHGSLDFNPKTFDDPKAILDRLHSWHFKVILHINAAPRRLHGEIPAAADETAAPDQIATYWPRHRKALAIGVDGWWPDDGDDLPIEARLARHRMYFSGSLHERPELRPFSLHRTGYAGLQRFGGWVWSGDTYCLWDTLAAHVPIGLNASVSLSPFWGSDTGGFTPTRQLTGELYTRWFQFSAFTPSFRSHGRLWHTRLPWGWNTGEFGPNEVVPGSLGSSAPAESELHNAQVEPVCRRYLELRYRLLPYLYAAAREAHDSGMPIMRPLWIHYPEDRRAVRRGDEYLWGRDILVAPVVAPGVTHRAVYLPEGLWYDYWSGTRVMGGQEVTRYVDLSTMPIYIRAGAILPLDPMRQYVDEPTDEPTTLRVYPGADGESVLYDDDGTSIDDARANPSWTRLRWNDQSRTLTIEPDERSRAKAPVTKRFRVQVVPQRVGREVNYDGKHAEVTMPERS